MQPDSTIPRWHWVNVTHGCPVHGPEIYKTRAFYPWKKSASLPYKWKIECPVGHELYPSNDFAAGDMTSGEFPDDGIGGACSHNGKRYGFIAEIAQAYCHEMLKVAPDCADAYIATDDVPLPPQVTRRLLPTGRRVVLPRHHDPSPPSQPPHTS